MCISGFKDFPLYDIFNMLGFVALLIFNITQSKKKQEFLGVVSRHIMLICQKRTRTKDLKVPLSFFEIVFFSLLQYAFTQNLNTSFAILTKTDSNYFGLLFFTPIILIVGCIFLGVNIFKQVDLLTPAFPLALIFAKTACFFNGCCQGFECSWGMTNYYYSQPKKEFPSQLVEMGLALLIFIFLMFWRNKAKEGTLFPTYLILYSVTRFFSEFTRNDPNVLWIFKTYHLLCLAGIVVGVTEWLIVKKYGDKINNKLENLYTIYENGLYQHALKNGLIKNVAIQHSKKRKKK